MTAGRGIIHSEMPQQENGRMRGFQLWINLPAKEKMKPAGYRDIQASEIPSVSFEGGSLKVVAGTYRNTKGPAQGGTTEPLYWDVQLNAGKAFAAEIPESHAVYVYPFEGSIEVEDRVLKTHQGAVLGSGDTVKVKAGPDGARFLVLAAKPIKEPIVQYGPFVMNTREEIEQAIRDYQSGELTTAPH
jgi:redox-sensitive bicupin YhaK (pirin superfamily)